LAALAGAVAGALAAALLLAVTSAVLAWKTSPLGLEVEHGVVYLAEVLGAGFGGLCGAVAGLAGVLARQPRDRTG
jgi:hypothetical protein